VDWIDALLDDVRSDPPPVKAAPLRWSANAYTGAFTFPCTTPDCDELVTVSASTVTTDDFDPNLVMCPDCALDGYDAYMDDVRLDLYGEVA
jgi:hypothetical protein